MSHANHFHLVIETPQPTLVGGMKWFLGTSTGRFNRRHKLFGHLETLVTLAWIAERLQMGSVTHVNTLLYQWSQGRPQNQLFIRTDPFRKSVKSQPIAAGTRVAAS